MRVLELFGSLLIMPIVLTTYMDMVFAVSTKAQGLAIESPKAKKKQLTQSQEDSQITPSQASDDESSDIEDFTAEQIKDMEKNSADFYDKGNYAASARLLKKIISWRQKYQDPVHPDIANSLNALGLSYKKQGSYAQAIPLYQRSLSIREKMFGPEHPDTATSLNNLGNLYLEQGLYAKSERFLLRSLSIREKVLGPEHPDTAISLNNLGLLYEAQGLYAKAEPLFQRSLSIREKVLGPEHFATAKLLNNLGLLYEAQGLYAKAEPLFQRSLLIREKALGPEHPSVPIALTNLAGFYRLRGLHAKAEPLFQRSLVILEKVLGPEHPHTGTTLNNLANLYYEQGLYVKAEQLYQRALAIAEKGRGPDHPDTAITLNNLAGLYEDQGLYEKAESFYKRSLAIREKAYGLVHPVTLIAISNLEGLYASQGKYTKAELLLKRALVIESTLIQREAPTMPRKDRTSFVTSFGYDYEVAFSGASRGGSGAELALFSRLNRQGLLEEIEKRQAQLAALPGDQEKVAIELRSVTQQLSSLSLSSEQREVLRQQQEQLERELYRLLPELKPRVVEVSDVASVLPKDGALVEFQRYQPYNGRNKDGERWGDARYLALVLKGNGSIASVDLGLADRIDRQVEKALIASEQRLADAEVLWAEVGELVMQPLAKAVVGVGTLVISPDGELNRMPFAALPAPDRGGLLAESYKLRLVTTGRELLDLKEPLQSQGKTPLVVANPDFDLVLSASGSGVVRGDVASRSTQKEKKESVFTERGQQRIAETDQLVWVPLPGTKKEGEFVAGLLAGRLLVEQNARAEAVQQTQAPVVLHIASHAFFLPDQKQENQEASGDEVMRAGLQGDRGLKASALATESPLLRSGIALAGANRVSQRKEDEEGDDGYLTALEVAQLDWKGTELVVISACESGKGDIRAGEGVYGLKRAIAVSGARSSLLSLWKVDDRATAAFMRSYYEKLKAGQGRAEALAITQNEFRNHRIPMWRHPYVWAAFQLSGDWRPIHGL